MSDCVFTFFDPRLPPRFWSKVVPEPTRGCWLWIGALAGEDYGAFWLDGRAVYAHRLSYQALVASIPLELELDHRCRTTVCVNPDHLEAVTHRENILRGASPAAIAAARATCSAGHPITAGSVYTKPDGSRYCRICGALAMKRYRAEWKAASR